MLAGLLRAGSVPAAAELAGVSRDRGYKLVHRLAERGLVSASRWGALHGAFVPRVRAIPVPALELDVLNKLCDRDEAGNLRRWSA